jgi:hypothetical protein
VTGLYHSHSRSQGRQSRRSASLPSRM